MATLADTGSTQVNENNPYQQALYNTQAANAFAGVDPNDPRATSSTLSAPNDKSSTVDNPSPSSSTGIVAQEKALEGTYPTAAQSVANTPEAATTQQSQSQENAQQEAAFSKTVNPSSKGAQAPTEQQNVNQALAPDQSALDALPAEYKSVIAQLQPYISGGTATGNSALDSADNAVSAEIGSSDDKVMAALKGLGTANKEFAGTVPYQGIVQALLGFGKYEETYEGAQPQDQQDWTQSMDEIYKYLSGSSASTDGLSTPQVAATTGAQNQSTGADDTAGGGNA